MPLTYQVRPAVAADYPKISALCAAEGWTSFDRPDFADALAHSITIVSCSDGEVVGYARALCDGFVTLFLCEILVAEEARREGHGRRLIDHLLALYPTARIDLISDVDDFYAVQGFRAIGSGMRLSRVRPEA